MLVVDSIPVETAFKMIEFLETCFGFSVILGHFEACFFFLKKHRESGKNTRRVGCEAGGLEGERLFQPMVSTLYPKGNYPRPRNF